MRPAGLQFTIRSIMIAVAMVAGLCAGPLNEGTHYRLRIIVPLHGF